MAWCGRLDEFMKTPSGNLSIADFQTVWLEEASDPPAFVQGKKKAWKQINGGLFLGGFV